MTETTTTEQPSFQAQNAVEELSTIKTEIDHLTGRKRDLEKVLVHELGNGTHEVAGLKVQVSTPRTLDPKAVEAAYPALENAALYKTVLDADAVKRAFAPNVLESFKKDGTTRVTLK